LYDEKESVQVQSHNRTLSKIKELSENLSQSLNKLSNQTNSELEINSLSDINELCHFLSDYRSDAFNLDLNQLQGLWEKKYTKFLGRFFGGYLKNLKAIKNVYRNQNGFDKRSIPDFLSKAMNNRQIFKKSGFFSDAGIPEIIRVIKGILRNFISEKNKSLELGKNIENLLDNKSLNLTVDEGNTANKDYPSLIDWFNEISTAKRQLIEKSGDGLDYYSRNLISEKILNLDNLKKEMASILFISENLMDMELFSTVIGELKSSGLTDFLKNYFNTDLSTKEMQIIFKKALYKKYLKYMYEQNETLYFFKSSDYETRRENFKELDVEQFSHNIRRIAKKRIDLNPKYNFFRNCESDLSQLKREISKR
jgi:hypothetical protein